MSRVHRLPLLLLWAWLGLCLAGPAAAASELPGDPRAARRAEAAAKEVAARRWLAGTRRPLPDADAYDVRHYTLALALDPEARQLSGTVTVGAVVGAAPIASLSLDLADFMPASAVRAGGQSVAFAHAAGQLAISLDRVYLPGESLSVAVDYGGDPSAGPETGYFGWDEHAGQPMIWTKSEPYGAPTWWPCKDLIADKADSLDLAVTVPTGLVVASNGLLRSVTGSGATRTWHWHSDYPICTYLVSLAVYPYAIHTDSYTPQAGGPAMPVTHYVFPDWWEDSEPSFSRTVPMLDHFAPSFGEYPFVAEKYGHAHFLWGGGMEHQTLTSIRGWWEDGVSHELAHQWFGDYVTCADFGHIWLNEGPATWAEAYWMEHRLHFEMYQLYMELAAYYGEGTIFVEDPQTEPIFDHDLAYDKGSWVMHMLRHQLGDAAFFAGLRGYLAAHAFAAATTEQFRDALEAASGRELDAFFQQWIYGEGVPDYRYHWTPQAGGLTLTIEQAQAGAGLFSLPIDVRVTTTSGAQRNFVVANSAASESYSLQFSGEPAFVQLDPESWLLCHTRSPLTPPSFDRGILLVNAVHWGLRKQELVGAYAAAAFTGDLPYTFWDCFEAWPGVTLPANLPPALGHGAVPGEVLARYSTVIWIADDEYGDRHYWQETPLYDYLLAGGNLIVIGRRGSQWLGADIAAYAGLSWAETDATLAECTAAYPGLGDLPLTGLQNNIDVFAPALGPYSALLWTATTGFAGPRGLGLHAQVPGGGRQRPAGGHLIYLAARPYRLAPAALHAASGFLLAHFCGEPGTGTALPPPAPASPLALAPAYPNPFNPQTTLRLSLPAAGRAELAILDVAGRRVRTLLAGAQAAGAQTLVWDGRDGAGRPAAAGLYLARLTAGGETRVQRLLLLR